MTFNFGQLVAAAWLGSLLALLWLYWPRRRRTNADLAPRIPEGSFLKSEAGATAIEYALVLVLVGLACVTVLENVATGLSGVFTSLSDTFTTVR